VAKVRKWIAYLVEKEIRPFVANAHSEVELIPQCVHGDEFDQRHHFCVGITESNRLEHSSRR